MQYNRLKFALIVHPCVDGGCTCNCNVLSLWLLFKPLILSWSWSDHSQQTKHVDDPILFQLEKSWRGFGLCKTALWANFSYYQFILKWKFMSSDTIHDCGIGGKDSWEQVGHGWSSQQSCCASTHALPLPWLSSDSTPWYPLLLLFAFSLFSLEKVKRSTR